MKKITEWIEVCEEAHMKQWKKNSVDIIGISSKQNILILFEIWDIVHSQTAQFVVLIYKNGQKREREDRDTKILQKINDIWKLLSACVFFVRKSFADFSKSQQYFDVSLSSRICMNWNTIETFKSKAIKTEQWKKIWRDSLSHSKLWRDMPTFPFKNAFFFTFF